jgi:hypothetical protein
MRRMLHLWLTLAIMLLGCRAVTPGVSSAPGSAGPGEQALIQQLPSPASPTASVLQPQAAEEAQPVDERQPPPDGYRVRFHPDGSLYVSDQVSLEVLAPAGVELQDRRVTVRVSAPIRAALGEQDFQPYGIGGRYQATFLWVWDTSRLAPGEYHLDFAIQPAGPSWTETVVLQPQGELPAPQPDARWETAESNCCVLHYISGTAAARDIPLLLLEADAQARSAMQKMGVAFAEPIQITLLNRVLGHGGFAGSEIYISYLERNYAGSDFQRVLHHEMIHILDARLGGELRPALFVEGLAVYLTGGHFKAEPLLSRAATLLELGGYLPLVSLADQFYTSQHEIGYLEGAALIQYMVGRWGWQAFWDFNRDIHPQPGARQADAIDAALRQHYGLTFLQLEQRFLGELRRQHVNPDLRDDLRLTVRYYEAVRRYQQQLDPSAYFLTAWLTDGPEMRQRGIVADFLRHPSAPLNVELESLLVAVDHHLRQGHYDRAEKTVAAVEKQLLMGSPARMGRAGTTKSWHRCTTARQPMPGMPAAPGSRSRQRAGCDSSAFSVLLGP